MGAACFLYAPASAVGLRFSPYQPFSSYDMKCPECFFIRKSDRKVLAFLLALGGLFAVLICWLGQSDPLTPLTPADSVATTGRVAGRDGGRRRAPVYYRVEDGRRVELFPFDPNTADSTDLLRLGLQPWQVRAVYKYRAKGGVYRTPHDFGRLYGMTRKQYNELAPYIRIGDDYLPAYEQFKSRREEAREQYERYKAADNYVPYREYDRDTVRYPVKIRPGEQIDLATADTTLLKKVPGIGSGWARRIVAYGKRLGGYYAVGQLRELDDFPAEALPFFRVSAPRVTRININRLTISQLRRHPYINYFQAKAICDYRRLKGPIRSLDQLRLLERDFPPEAIERLSHYVEF